MATQKGHKAQQELERTKEAAARRGIRERASAEVEKVKNQLKRERAKMKDGTGRFVQAAEVLVGAGVAGAIEGAYPDAKLGPLDARKGVTLLAAGVGLFVKGPVGNHAMNVAEGMAASIVSDFGKQAGQDWKSKSGKDSGASTTSTSTQGAADDAVTKLRRVTMSTPGREPDRRERDRVRRRAGGGYP